MTKNAWCQTLGIPPPRLEAAVKFLRALWEGDGMGRGLPDGEEDLDGGKGRGA